MSDRIIELRVHGVSGTPPESLPDDPHPHQVAGDDVARFFRRSEPIGTQSGARTRDVEAFHWGRLTAGSPSRALWLLLAPFAIVNLARFTLLLPKATTMDGIDSDRTMRSRFADIVLRLLGLTLTMLLVSSVSYVSLELLAHQCVSSKVCVEGNSWLSFLDNQPLVGQP